MNTADQKAPRIRHQFGGCNKLLSEYRVIGFELLRYERDTRTLGFGFNIEPAQESLRTGLAFIHNTVLESYLEDLLNLDVDEAKLFLRRGSLLPSTFQQGASIALVGAIVGLFVHYGTTYPIAASASGACAAVLAAHYFLPRSRIVRRMRFARIISMELTRRSGGDRRGKRFNLVEFTTARKLHDAAM